MTVRAGRLTSSAGTLLTVPVTLNGQKFAFVLDSGATSTVLDATAAAGAGLRPMPAPATVRVHTLGCTPKVQLTTVPKWAIGSQQLPSSKLLTQHLGLPSTPVGGLRLGGLLGADVQALDTRISIDYTHNQVTFGGGAPTGGRSVAVKILRSGGQVAVTAPARIGSTRLTVAIDTGASRTTVSTRVGQATHLTKNGRPTQVNAAGCPATVQPVELRHADLGTIALPTLTVNQSANGSPLGPAVPATIGSDLLSHFGAITIDYSRSTLTLGS